MSTSLCTCRTDEASSHVHMTPHCGAGTWRVARRLVTTGEDEGDGAPVWCIAFISKQQDHEAKRRRDSEIVEHRNGESNRKNGPDILRLCIQCVGVSDGKRVVRRSYDGTARVWDVESGKTVLGPIKAHE